MNEELQSFVPSVTILGAMAVAAMVVTVVRGGVRGDAVALRKAVAVAALTVLLQVGHFSEEAFTGLNRRLPQLFDLEPVSLASFVTVNVVALSVWLLSIGALRQRLSWALFPLWFLAIACVANAVLHPALSLVTGGYFPGLITSPVMGVAGVLLLRRLARITRDDGSVA